MASTDAEPDLRWYRESVNWLRALAEDVLDHEGCDGCKVNAQAALDHLAARPDLAGSPVAIEPSADASEGLNFDL